MRSERLNWMSRLNKETVVINRTIRAKNTGQGFRGGDHPRFDLHTSELHSSAKLL